MKKKERSSRTAFPEKLGKILREALRQRNISLSLKDQPLWDAWREAVGPLIAAQTQVDRFDRETLFVKVSSPVWMQQLQFMKAEIITRINGILGREVVKNLYFSVGVIPQAGTKKKQEAAFKFELFPLKEREKKLIENCSSAVSDRELGEILRRAMTKNIIRRKIDEKGRNR